MCDNIQKCCRICLDEESQHVSILGDPTISLHLKSCLSVNISSNDHLPKTICVSCVSLLNQFYNFQLNARCSQDWLESSVQEKMKKTPETKMPLQPLPDSEYNSDSLLEFLNNTANIEEYLNNLGKEDIPCIVNMLDKNEQSLEIIKNKPIKASSPKKNEPKKLKLEIDAFNTDFRIVKDLIKIDMDQKNKPLQLKEINTSVCYGCKINCDSVTKLLQHLSVCEIACRTCMHCKMLFDSKQRMQQHAVTHNVSQALTCNCGEQFPTKEKLMNHHKTCHSDYGTIVGCAYKCKECGYIFKERFQLYKHAKKHIVKTEERICDICGHTFNGSDALIKHKIEEHEKPADCMYKCKICNMTSSDRKEMFLHVKKHTTRTEPTRHLCESCGRGFATHTTLLRHALQHNGIQKKCNICGRICKDAKMLDQHIVDHIQMVMCEKCGQKVNSFKLDQHSCV